MREEIREKKVKGKRLNDIFCNNWYIIFIIYQLNCSILKESMETFCIIDFWDRLKLSNILGILKQHISQYFIEPEALITSIY